MCDSKYEKEYSEESFWSKVAKVAKKAGAKIIYVALLLYYVLQKKDIPTRVKATIIGSLGYLVSPLDAIPDITPVVGYTDDFGVLILALSIASVHIDQEVKDKAKSKMKDWFGEDECESMNEIDGSL